MEELERQRQEEQKRLQDLENRALRWTKAAQLRAFIAEVEKKAGESKLQPEGKELLESWLHWASVHVDRLDPLITAGWGTR